MKTQTMLFLFLTLVATAANAQRADAPAPEMKRFAMLARDFNGVFEVRDPKNGTWSSQQVDVDGREILAGRFVENRGRFHIAGEPRPSDMRIIWSYDPFQKRYRLAVLDDLVGLLDVFEQTASEPLTLTSANGNRVTLRALDGGKVRVDAAASHDGGKTWNEGIRLTLTPR